MKTKNKQQQQQLENDIILHLNEVHRRTRNHFYQWRRAKKATSKITAHNKDVT